MLQLFVSALVALPCFSSVLLSEGAQSIVYTREIDSGYLAVGSLSDGWGGAPHTVVYKMDQYGMVISQTTSSSPGEPFAATDYEDGVAVVCLDFQNELSRVAYFDNAGSEQWVSQLSGGIFENAVIRSSSADLIVAGNDSGSPRLVKLDNLGNILWSTTYPAISFSVRDVCSCDGEIFVLGTTEEPGWQSNVCLLVVDFIGGSPDLYTLFSGEGRCSPEAIEVDSRGIFILLNAMTIENNMIYETKLIKLSSSLETLWTASFAGTSWQRGSDLISLDSGSFGVCGWTNSIPLSESNRSDLMLCEFNESGELEWDRAHGTLSTDYGLSLSAVSDGGFLVSGCITEDLYQGWLLKTDSLGLIEPQGISDSSQSEFIAVPLSNPLVNGILPLIVNSPDSGVIEIFIYDIAGRTVAGLSSSIATGENLINLPVVLPPGVYSVRISSGIYESIFRTVVSGGE